MWKYIFILLVLTVGCRKDFAYVIAIERKEGLEAIKDCQELDQYYSSSGIDTVGISKYCHEDYKYPPGIYLWECKYIEKLYEMDKSLNDIAGCWHYYIDGHQFSIHHHNKNPD